MVEKQHKVFREEADQKASGKLLEFSYPEKKITPTNSLRCLDVITLTIVNTAIGAS